MTYGLFTIGAAEVALPLTAVREVTPCPPELAALPTTAPGLLGAVNLRGQVIAVIDLLALNGPATERTAPRVIVVMLHAEGLLGLIVDSVHGVSTPVGLQTVSAPGQRLPVSHTFPSPEGTGIVSVLDVETMFALPGVPVVHDDRSGSSSGAFQTGDAGERRLDAADLSGSILLVRCAGHRLAVNIDAVHTIVPRVQVRSSPLRHGSCRGVTDFGGAEIPVFDPLALAGLGELTAADTEGVAVKFEDGVVIMLLSEVLELIPASSAHRFALPEMPVPGRRYLDGVVRVPGRGDFLCLAMDQILGHEDLNALSRLNTPHAELIPGPRDGEEGNTGDTGEARAGETYLTFSVDPEAKDLATPLRQVIEILPFPEQYSVLQAGDESVLGLFTHRDTVVPLFRLAGVLSLPTRAPAVYVLLVAHPGGDREGEDGQVVGLAVHALRAIERSVWEEDPGPEPAQRRMIRLAAIGTSDEPRMLSRVDLAAIGAALIPPALIPPALVPPAPIPPGRSVPMESAVVTHSV